MSAVWCFEPDLNCEFKGKLLRSLRGDEGISGHVSQEELKPDLWSPKVKIFQYFGRSERFQAFATVSTVEKLMLMSYSRVHLSFHFSNTFLDNKIVEGPKRQ